MRALAGSFDRVRMGSLESFHLRSAPQSRVAGTVYLGGDALGANGQPISGAHVVAEDVDGNPAFPAGTPVLATERTRDYLLYFDGPSWTGPAGEGAGSRPSP